MKGEWPDGSGVATTLSANLHYPALAILNAVIACGFIGLSAWLRLSSKAGGENQEAFVFLAAAGWFMLIASGFALNWRLLLFLASGAVILTAGVLMFMLLFAPLAWGQSNMSAVWLLQSVLLLIVILQIIGLIAIMSTEKG